MTQQDWTLALKALTGVAVVGGVFLLLVLMWDAGFEAGQRYQFARDCAAHQGVVVGDACIDARAVLSMQQTD